MYGSSLSVLSDAWESVAAAKKELTNVDAKIRQSGVRQVPDSTANLPFTDHSRRCKENPNIERRVVMDYPTSHGMYRKENIPPSAYPQPKAPDFSRKGDNFNPDAYSALGKESYSPVKHKENYAPDFNYDLIMSRDKGMMNSSLSGRVLLAKKSCDSNALSRLKEKINQQKMNASISTMPQQETFTIGNLETEPVQMKDGIGIKEPMKRKVTQAPPAPAYKGFNQTEGHANKAGADMQRKYYPKDSKVQKRDQTKGKATKDKRSEQTKMTRKVKASKGKMQRIVSPKKPVPPITTTTWRIGQEIRQNLLKERKKKKADSKPVEKTAPDSSITSNYAEKPYEESYLPSKGVTQTSEKVESEPNQDTVNEEVSLPKDVYQDINEKSDEELKEQDISEAIISEESATHSEGIKISVSKSESEAKDYKALSKNAMSIMKDINDEPTQKSESLPKGKPCAKSRVKGVVDTGLKKRKMDKTSKAVKRKSDEDCYPKQKIRHYDQDEVKKYMQKKQAERKEQRLKEKQLKEQRKEIQQNKLKELYNKQKEAVKENLEIGKRNVYGETFLKLSSKISAIMSDPTYTSSHDESTGVVSSKDISKDIPTYPIPQEASSPQQKIDDTADDIIKDSLEVTGLTNGDISSLKPVSPYKPSGNVKPGQCSTLQNVDENTSPNIASSKANRVAAIHSTAAALRKRLDLEARRLSCLVQTRQANQTKSTNETVISDVPDLQPQGFTGEIPGTHNIDEQATMNLKLLKMDEAAKRIQAFYRGHCTRKSLHWKMPSGRTLFEAFESARRSAFLSDIKAEPTVTLASNGYPPITFSNVGKEVETSIKLAEPLQLDNTDIAAATSAQQPLCVDDIISRPDEELPELDENSVLSDKHGSTASLITDALTVSRTLQQELRKTSAKLSNHTSKNSSNTVGNTMESFPSYSGENVLSSQQKLLQAVDEKAESLKKVLEKHKKVAGDRYSVINIFARNYPGLRRQQLLSDVKNVSDSDTEIILAEAYVEEMKTSKEDSDDEYLTEQSVESLEEHSLEETLTEQNLNEAAEMSCDKIPFSTSHDESTISLSLADLPPKLQASSNASVHSLKSSQHGDNKKASYTSVEVDSDTSQEASAGLISQAFSDIDTNDLKPVFSSTQRSMDAKELTSERSKTHSVDFKISAIEENLNRDGTGDIKNLETARMSPNTLERKLRAEINLFESVGGSLQHAGEMERVRNVVDAQQESVALAQLLKSRNATHQQDMARMSMAARERAMESAQEVEKVKRAAAETSVNVMKSIAEVKAKAAEEIAASAVHLAQIQQQTAANTMDALNQVEQARQAAAAAYKQSVDQQLPVVGELAAQIALNVARQQKSTPVRSSISTAAPSDPNYTDDFEGNKTGSSKQGSFSATSGSKTGSSRQSTLTPAEKTASSSRLNSTSTGKKSSRSIAEEFDGSAVTSTQQSGEDRSVTESFHPLSFVKSASALSVNTAESFTGKSSQNSSVKEDIHSHSESVAEELTFKDLDTPRTTKSEAKTDQNKDGSADLFEKTLIESVVSVNEDSFSGNSEDKINSSLTEEELKHDFRMVLPSENHRRKSLDCIDNFLAGNDTSSDEVLDSPRVAGKLMKKLRSKSPFADENTFTKFTANMVRQYIQEDEVRAKHQAALLELREKAIIEKTKAEMTYLEMQKKTLKSRGYDEKMPPITKKQRAVLLRLQAEQSEIRRLKEAHKAASFERRSMLYQQKQIEKIRETTQKIWSKLEHMDKSDTSTKNLSGNTLKSQVTSPKEISVELSKTVQENSHSSHNQVSSEIPDEAPFTERSHSESIEESVVAEEKSQKDSSPQTVSTVPSSTQNKRVMSSKSDESKTDSISESAVTSRKEDVSSTLQDSKDDSSSIAQDLKKLMYKSGKRYLSDREKKLEIRKQQFTEIMSRESQLKDWRQKIIDEELRLKEDIRRVLEKSAKKDVSLPLSSEKRSPSSKQLNNTSSSSETLVKEMENTTLQGGDTLSVKEDYSSAKDSNMVPAEDSIIEEVLSETSPVKSQSAEIFSEISKRSRSEDGKTPVSQSTAYKYSEGFENGTEAISGKEAVSSSLKDTKRSEVSQSSRGLTRYSKKVEDDSLTENTSDASDIEQRLKGLEDELENRRLELERLRKKKEKEILRLKEQELKKALQDVEQQIIRENKENLVPGYRRTGHEKSIPSGLSERSIQADLSEKSIPSLSAQAVQTRSLKTDLSDADIRTRRSDLSPRPPSSKKMSSELSPRRVITDRSTEARKSFEKSAGTNVSASLQPTVNEEIKSSIHSSKNQSEKGVETELSHSKPGSISKSKSDSISTATDIGVVDDKSDKTSVSEQLVSLSKNGKESILSRNGSMPENKPDSPAVSKASTDLGDMYGDDFEGESGGDGSPRSYTKKSLLTEEELSELSEEILSEYSHKSSNLNGSYKNGHISAGEKDELSEKSKHLSLKLDLSGVQPKSDEEISVSEEKSKLSGKSSRQDIEHGGVSGNKSVTSAKNLENKDGAKGSEPMTYEDSFVADTSRQSTAADESLKSDRVGDSRDTSRRSFSEGRNTANFGINDRVLVEGIMRGVIRFIGKTPFSPVLVAGIHLDEAVGTNDGTFQGRKYFDCGEDFGLFTTLDRLKRVPDDEKEGEISQGKDTSVEEVEEEILAVTSPVASFSNDIIQKPPSLPSGDKLNEFIENEACVSEKHASVEDILSRSKIVDQDDDLEPDILSKSSSSDADSSEAEIPSPQKPALGPIADGITESILKTLLLEAFRPPLAVHENLTQKSRENSISHSVTESINDTKLDESGPTSSVKSQVSRKEQKDEYKESKSRSPEDVNSVTKKLIDEALSHMINIKKTKQQKLITTPAENELPSKDLIGTDRFLSLIADDDTTDKSNVSEDDKDDFLGIDDDLDDNLTKIDSLRSVEDHLQALCGVDDELEDISKTSIEGRVFLPQKIARVEEVLQIPWTITDTRSLVYSALNELTNDSVTNENLASVDPSDEYFSETLNNKNFNEQYTKLYKRLIFDSTKSILCEISEFHELQNRRKPPWMKAPRKTFSKFTHNAHMLDAEKLCQVIANHISTCLDLQDGRPSLEKLKRRLPLNLNKKDYVDAVLVEEIREEEPQWVNYDEDELKVKFQLADDILNNLIQEIVDIINV